MTCVAAVGHEGRVWIGSDAVGLDDGDLVFRLQEPKVFLKGPFLIGCAGTHLANQLIRRLWMPDKKWEENRLALKDEGVMWRVRDSLWEFLHEAGRWELMCQKDDPQLMHGAFIIGYRGTVWHIGVDGTVDTFEANYHAIGTGQEVALGSLHTTQQMIKDCPFHRVELALQAAEYHLSAIEGPFTILEA